MTLSDRIREILHDRTPYSTEFVNDATNDILSEIRKVVPEEKFRVAGIQDSIASDGPIEILKGYSPEQKAWNTCRQEILERLR